jgi:glutamine amidotransferase
MITIIDYGMGNSGSIMNMLKFVGVDSVITSDPELISKATAIILPGVGSFDNGIRKLKALDSFNRICEKVITDRVPFLGICLGMQLLFNSSEEGTENGLGWISGRVRKFPINLNNDLKVPHMGWNEVQITQENLLLKKELEECRFYFVHSYYLDCDLTQTIGSTNYGMKFTSAVNSNNIFGVQFHPEKSHKFGISLFQNFIKLI